MRVSLIKSNFIKDLILPTDIAGSFWLSDYDDNGNERNILNIEATNEGWKAVSNNDVFCIVNDRKVDEIALKDYNFYLLKDRQDNSYILVYCSPVNDPNFKLYEIPSMVDGLTIGKDNKNDIVYATDFIAPVQARVSLLGLEENVDKNFNNKLIVKDQDPKYNVSGSKWGVYVNNKRVEGQKVIENNDVIFIMGLKIIISKLGNKYVAAINNPNGQVYVQKLTPLNMTQNQNEGFTEDEEEIEMNLYRAGDYFYKKPRFINRVETLELSVDAPPTKEEEQDQSLILTIGPMLTMSMTSLVMGYSAVNNVANNNGSWSNAIPSIVICLAMFGSIFIWPVIMKHYEKKKRERNEKERQVKYNKYIENKRKVIQDEVARQEKVLRYSYPTTKECQDIIMSRNDRLWERKIEDDDFLEVSLGTGNRDMQINIKYPEDHFSMAEDNLKDMVTKLGTEPKVLQNVPIELSLMKYNLLAIVGEHKNNINLASQILLQVLALHSYDDLKLVILTSKEKESYWEPFKIAPHLFSDDKSIRYFGTVSEEHKEVCYNLEQVYLSRKNTDNESSSDNKTYQPHYLIITDSYKTVRNQEVIKNLLEEKENIGFSLIILNDTVSSLPNQCQTFINSGESTCELFRSLLNNKKQQFYLNNNDFYDYNLCIKILANIPIEIDRNKSGKLPDKIGFLQMYEALKIEQLNIANRWQKNSPVLSLGAPVGVSRDGEKIVLDLHEKYHGPHGLIAGMTGSGKSEFIITYILSMAINYHPYEVQFILIDYKGGGLAGAFENKTTGVKLPHIVGTITNLDSVEIKRSFASIESELKRRQAAFNKAREISGESTVDIYKYQKMYREGAINEPVSHLFIICDEFAELKTQEPEFMDQLISTARIGRSLGVHLILATQKPSGVVDPQIWSNTRFRVCLRVQEKSDSSEVIKCADAAFLKQTGRFYFQVGFNEIFELGQAAWAGGPYIPSDKLRKDLDTSIDFINNMGYTYKTIETKVKQEIAQVDNGEELSNIVNTVSAIAKEQNIQCTPLWLERIPENIYVDNLEQKYNYQKEEHMINPIIGEYDNPNMQQQHLLTMPLTKEGNALIYGAAGSGKENMITTVLYSLMKYNTPEDLSCYILDFGSESLKMFNNCPIVGDVLTSTDDEKIENLYKMLFNIIEQRKKLFANYGGDYLTYIKNSNEKLPAVVVIINNYETYQELQEAHDEDLVILTRDCVKYGIYFIITVTTPNGIRFKLKQNFNHEYVLNQNNEDDYITILGSVNKTYPSKLFGRGIIKTDSVYEFQTALVTEKDNINSYITDFNNKLSEKIQNKAPAIKVLPEIVSFNDIKESIGIKNELVIGIDKQTLAPATLNYTKDSVNLITTMDITLAYQMIKPIINQLLYQKKKVIFINTEDYSLDSVYNSYITYADSNFDDIFEKLNAHITNVYDQYVANNYSKKAIQLPEPLVVMINGISQFKNKLNSENQSKFGDIFQKSSELGIINFIIIDSIENIRKIEIDPWYKNTVNTSNGIWVGNGINEQFSLKVIQKNKDVKSEVEDDFCFILRRGKPALVKILKEFELKL